MCHSAAEGLSIGQKYHTRWFARDVSFLAARCVQGHDAADLRTPLPGLGIPTSIGLVLDGIPVHGLNAFGRHGTVTVVCVSATSHYTGRLHAMYLSWMIQSQGHGGRATAASVLQLLARPPFYFDKALLQRILSCVGGDGAIAQGGARSRGFERNSGCGVAVVVCVRS